MLRIGLYVVVVGIFSCLEARGQVNLVPNPSFEVFDTCPNTVEQIYRAVPWFQPNNPRIYGSTDFFHQCDTAFVSVPNNLSGFQNANSGVGYAGIGIFLSPGNGDIGREYLEVELLDSLTAGKRYCGNYHVALANNVLAGVSNLQMYFTSDSCLYVSSAHTYYPAAFQISYIGPPIIDSMNWTNVQGSYTAQGGERFITIGNFSPGSLTNYTCLGTPCGGAYYYIDDVSVVLLPDLDAGSADTICMNDSIILNGTVSETWPGMSFEWLPHTGLSDPFSLVTSASSQSTITYTLTVSCPTCDVPCLADIPDSVTITVTPMVNAPDDDTICIGDSLLLSGTISDQWLGMQYEWLPHTGLSNPYSLNTNASPSIATTYTLTATCPACGITSCETLRDSVTIAVQMDCVPVFNEMIVPTVIGENQRWEILFLQPNTRVKIFDERGRVIYTSENYQNDWVPMISGAMYLYELQLSNGSSSNGKVIVK